MNENKLTKKEAFLAMYSFLESYYQLTDSDDVGGLLGIMSLLEDGSPVDSAISEDWEDAVKNVLSGKVNAKLQLKNT